MDIIIRNIQKDIHIEGMPDGYKVETTGVTKGGNTFGAYYFIGAEVAEVINPDMTFIKIRDYIFPKDKIVYITKYENGVEVVISDTYKPIIWFKDIEDRDKRFEEILQILNDKPEEWIAEKTKLFLKHYNEKYKIW